MQAEDEETKEDGREEEMEETEEENDKEKENAEKKSFSGVAVLKARHVPGILLFSV